MELFVALVTAAGIQGIFGQCSQTQGLNLRWSCAEPGIGPDNLCASLLRGFYDQFFPLVACDSLLLSGILVFLA